MKTEFKYKNVSIIGAARSGVAVAQLLRSQGANVFVSDKDLSEKVTSLIPHFKSLGVAYEFGQHTSRVFETDVLVLSPGVPSNAQVVLDALSKGIKVVSEIEVAGWFCLAQIIAITGSNGKTTTTTLTGRMFSDAGKRHAVAGNIGNAFSSVVSQLDSTSTAVLEVSSFQLDHIDTFHPNVSVILNITPDHLDRYSGSFDAYKGAKGKIFLNQTKADYLIYCYDDQQTKDLVFSKAISFVRALPFGVKREFESGAYVRDGKMFTCIEGKEQEIINAKEISIKGVHNLYNAMAATLASQVMGVSVASIRSTLKNFKGVEHRLEFVREVNGVRYINDSKATNIDSVSYALKAYEHPIVLLLGGRDKGNDYSALYEEVKKHVKTIIAIGESADKVVKSFEAQTKIERADSMKEAIEIAQRVSVAGDIVLLSPACASFDWFENYEHRGRVFKEFVHQLEEK
ncbi:MAG: UDP-N-acetylmuramoyl-L-alanine--D-glutamate ligase [Ignavibacteriae bacterium]|nr:UDP-N-acetylmuramoyl-L-alanine--D-glutamate ligase [Ignavibacteriota bacterium]